MGNLKSSLPSPKRVRKVFVQSIATESYNREQLRRLCSARDFRRCGYYEMISSVLQTSATWVLHQVQCTRVEKWSSVFVLNLYWTSSFPSSSCDVSFYGLIFSFHARVTRFVICEYYGPLSFHLSIIQKVTSHTAIERKPRAIGHCQFSASANAINLNEYFIGEKQQVLWIPAQAFNRD